MSYNIRLCTVNKRNDFEGYGFNLHSEANKPGQFIGHVENGSPAYQAGLLKNDILLEVNGFNVCDENHQQVVSRIKENPSSVTVLIIDHDGFNYCKAQNIEMKKEMAKTMETVPNKVKEIHHEERMVVNEHHDNNKSDNVSSNDKSNLEDLSIDEIRAKVAESGARKRRERNAPITFKDRANIFEQL